MKYFPFLFVFTFLACGSEQKNKQMKSQGIKEETRLEDSSPREYVTFIRPSIELPNSALADLNRVKKKFKFVPYFTQTQDGNLFLVSNRKINPSEMKDSKPKKGILFGLANGRGDTLLPIIYQKIGNPGIYADGFIELFKNKKYTLYDYINNTIISKEFDVLYPSTVMGYLAIGKKENSFFKIYDDGEIKKITDEEDFPSYKTISQQLQFDVQSELFGLWMNTELYSSENKDQVLAGFYVTPSYIDVLGIIPSFIPNITLKGSSIGTEQLKITEISHRIRSKDTRTMAVAFMEQGLDARGWINEQQHVVTTDSKNNIKNKRKVNSTNDYNLQNLCKDCEPHGFRFINDSLLEVRYWVFPDNEYAKPGMDSLFVAMTQFSYFRISSDGKITPIHEGSIFPMASLIPLEKSMLRGCFFKNDQQYPNILSYPILEDFEDFGADDDQPWTLEFNQLTAGDIRFMINEIYARHGYIFADKKLNSFFKAKKWYKALSRNVEQKITPLERQNIYFLETIEKQLRQNEKEQLQPKRRILVWAG